MVTYVYVLDSIIVLYIKLANVIILYMKQDQQAVLCAWRACGSIIATYLSQYCSNEL